MLAENYLEAPSIAIQFRGVQDGQALLAVQCAGMCRAFSRVGGVTTCGDLAGIAVRKDLRGTGIFRKVISPVLSEAERRGIPVVLQAFEPDNVRKYEHMGFQCMETVPSETLDLTCYNLLKR